MTSLPRSTPSPARPGWAFWLIALTVALLYGAVAAFHVAYGAMNLDEGFYAAASRAIWQGEMPYRDFGFTQPPLVAYVNAPALALLRFGLFEQRIVNGLWGALALAIAAWLVARRGHRSSALLLASLFALSPAWMYFTHLGKTYGFTSLLVMAMVAVFLEAKPGWRRSFALSVIAVLGVAARLPATPFFGLLWVWDWFLGERLGVREIALRCTLAGVCAAAAFLPFYTAAPEQVVFWIFDFHRLSVPQREWRLQWNDFLGLAPAVLLLVITTLALRRFGRAADGRRDLAVLAASALALGCNLFPRGAYEEYGVPFLLPAAAASLILLQPIVSNTSRRRRWIATLLVLLAPFALIPAINWTRLAPAQRTLPSVWLPPNAHPYNLELPSSIAAARKIVTDLLPADQPFVGPAIILAVEAEREISRRFRMGAFTLTHELDETTADRLHLATSEQFEKSLRDIDAPLVALHRQVIFNYAWSMPSFNPPPPEAMGRVESLLRRYFTPVYGDRDFLLLARPHVLPFAAQSNSPQ